MSFSDYDYSDDSNDTLRPVLMSNFEHHSNSTPSFQEKNDAPMRLNSKFDYAKIVQENHVRKRQQLHDLRLSHAQKRASLAARFDLSPSFMPPIGMVMSSYKGDIIKKQ